MWPPGNNKRVRVDGLHAHFEDRANREKNRIFPRSHWFRGGSSVDSKISGETWWETGCLQNLQVSSHKRFINCKNRESLADAIFTRGSALTSPVMRQIDIVCLDGTKHLRGHNFHLEPCPQCNIRQPQIRGCSARYLACTPKGKEKSKHNNWGTASDLKTLKFIDKIVSHSSFCYRGHYWVNRQNLN